MAAPSLKAYEQRATQAENLLLKLKQHVKLISSYSGDPSSTSEVSSEVVKLQTEKNKLQQEVERLKQRLIYLEILDGRRQIPIPLCSPSIATAADTVTSTETNKTTNTTAQRGNENDRSTADTEKAKQAKETKVGRKGEKPASDDGKKNRGADGGNKPLDVSRLNMKIGRIVDAKRHPDADSLYVEEVDIGEANHRTIVSGLVRHVPIEQMKDRLAIFCCNLKPAKMRGILSEGMIMCASSPEKVEIIDPPAECIPGERVIVEEFPGDPDLQLNPKRKIFEQIQPELQTNNEGVATYKGCKWVVKGKGVCKAATMTGSNIK